MSTEQEHVRLVLTGKANNGSRWASANEHARAAIASPSLRHRCDCGCKGRKTHVGLANGYAMMSGCEMRVRRWVRDPLADLRVSASEDREAGR